MVVSVASLMEGEALVIKKKNLQGGGRIEMELEDAQTNDVVILAPAGSESWEHWL